MEEAQNPVQEEAVFNTIIPLMVAGEEIATNLR